MRLKLSLTFCVDVFQMLCEDYAEIVDEDDADYSSPTRDFELDRSRVDLVHIL